jgi:uncharacterized membrane protein SirB2
VVNYYSGIKTLHIVCVSLSGILFAVRGALMMSASTYANHRILARLSYVIDTSLLASAIILTTIIQQYPFVQPWLTVKVLLLPVYIVLGAFALRRGKTRSSRTGFFLAALTVYGLIVSVAVTHNPYGLFGSRTV